MARNPNKKNFSRSDLLNHPLYGPLRELLVDKIRTELERPLTHFVIVKDSPTDNYDRDRVLREIARIEKSWDLI
jgi:hypothetical protein